MDIDWRSSTKMRENVKRRVEIDWLWGLKHTLILSIPILLALVRAALPLRKWVSSMTTVCLFASLGPVCGTGIRAVCVRGGRACAHSHLQGPRSRVPDGAARGQRLHAISLLLLGLHLNFIGTV